MRPQGSQAELERRRRRAIGLLKQGQQPVDVARIVGVDRRSVRRWNAAFRANGDAGIKARPMSGRPVKLKLRHRERLVRLLLRGAREAGFPTDLWTCARVAALIDRRFRVSYHVDHIGRLLRVLGFSPQKPQRRALERNEDEIQRWVREEWPQLKKKPVA